MTIDATRTEDPDASAPAPAQDGAPAGVAGHPRRRWQDPTVLGVLVLAVAVIGFAIWWFLIRTTDGGTAAATPTDQVVAATTGDMSRTVSATGTVAAAQSASLSFSSPGTVTAVNVKAGDTVTTGEVLASIDPVQLQADVSAAQSSVASAEAKLSDDRAAGASSAQLAADEASVTSATDALTSAQADLAGASLVSTFDGTVASVEPHRRSAARLRWRRGQLGDRLGQRVGPDVVLPRLGRQRRLRQQQLDGRRIVRVERTDRAGQQRPLHRVARSREQ